MNLRRLMGSGDKIMLATAPVLVIGLVLNVLYPEFFSVDGPPPALRMLSIIVLALGLIIWLWSVVLILVRVPKHELITDGPYALVKHPLYTSVALLVLPFLGFLLNTWLGLVIGIVLYAASRRFSSEEERELAEAFGTAWDSYCQNVKMAWL
jgi:protein-S-isoprenylcysteine O-methyltransferase Ste14